VTVECSLEAGYFDDVDSSFENHVFYSQGSNDLPVGRFAESLRL
jgi:hypothetical protein